MKTLLAAAMIAALIAAPALAKKPLPKRDCGTVPETFTGIAFTGDGDTINGVGFRPGIRLWGMNAPELRDRDRAETVPGMRARAFVAELLEAAGNKVTCEPIEWDAYCRVVATCTTAKGADLTMETLKQGLAYGFYLAKHPGRVETALAYSHAEAEARAERRGLWSTWLR